LSEPSEEGGPRFGADFEDGVKFVRELLNGVRQFVGKQSIAGLFVRLGIETMAENALSRPTV